MQFETTISNVLCIVAQYNNWNYDVRLFYMYSIYSTRDKEKKVLRRMTMKKNREGERATPGRLN